MISTAAAPVTAFEAPTMRTKKILIAIPAPINGNIDGTDVYEIHDGSNFTHVRLEKGQDVEELVKIIDDLKFLYVYGRHDISRIHLFSAVGINGNQFSFAMTYSQAYKLGLLAGFDDIYQDLEGHCSQPISMGHRFKPRGVLAFDGRREWTKEHETYMDILGEDFSSFNWE